MKKIIMIIKNFFAQSAKQTGVSRYSAAEINEIMARPIDPKKEAEFLEGILPFAEKIRQIRQDTSSE